MATLPEPRMHAWALTGKGPRSDNYALTLDGEDITNSLAGVSLHLQAQSRLTLVLYPALIDDVTTEGQAVVVLPEDVQELLVRLGWTPPPGHACDDGVEATATTPCPACSCGCSAPPPIPAENEEPEDFDG